MGFQCDGFGEDHCCYVEGKPCPFLEFGTMPGRGYVCGLKRELGTWERVHQDPRYSTIVQPVWRRRGVPDCGDFTPRPGQCCRKDLP